tara:strand:- start:51079 stop:52329 length:1251 start_codon:yes stop_codon:yes gene_type:complete
MNKKNILILFFFLNISSFLKGQVEEVSEPINIKTIIFKGENENDQFPIISIDENITLSFDDLNSNEEDYYYRIKHYNFDWKESELFKNEIIEGFDNVRIMNYSNSFNTLQPYTHYELKFPNDKTRFLVSGNYMIEIYNSLDEIIFSRKFCIYEKKVDTNVNVYRLQDMEFFKTHQSIHFSITPKNTIFREPEKRIKVTIIKNYQWSSQINNLKPQYITNSKLEYKYDKESKFEGGNEYLFFDTKEIRSTNQNISYINRSDLYETFLKIDNSRNYNNYIYNQDINGNFKIRTLNGSQNSKTEADYTWVHFSLASDMNFEETSIYIYGKFNNYKLTENNKMYYNPSMELYEGVLLLKQGFYNYKYVSKKNDSLNKNNISGSYAVTENEYLILVYYKDIGGKFDKLIGVGKTNSFNLKN